MVRKRKATKSVRKTQLEPGLEEEEATGKAASRHPAPSCVQYLLSNKPRGRRRLCLMLQM